MKDSNSSIPNYRASGNSKQIVYNLKTYGTKQGAKHKGSIESLKVLLSRIVSGVIVEEGENGELQKQYEEEIQNDISAVEENNLDSQTRIKNIIQNLIPQSKRKIDGYKEDIGEVQADAKKGVIDLKYSRLMHILYAVFSIVLFFFVFFYYSSLTNMAFFGGQNADGNIVLGVFDPSIFYNIPEQWLIIFTAPIVFMAVGFIGHKMMGTEKKPLARIIIFALIVLFEALPAHLITTNHLSLEKQMNSISNTDFSAGFGGDLSAQSAIESEEIVVGFWEPFTDVQFYMLLLIGLASYMLLAVFIEYLVKENEKRNPEKVARIEVDQKKMQINEIQESVDSLQSEANELEGNLEKGGQKIALLREKLNKYIYSPTDLSGKLESFFDGWLIYINQIDILNANIGEHYQVFESFKEEIKKAA